MSFVSKCKEKFSFNQVTGATKDKLQKIKYKTNTSFIHTLQTFTNFWGGLIILKYMEYYFMTKT